MNRLQHNSFIAKELTCADGYICLHLYAGVTDFGGHFLGTKTKRLFYASWDKIRILYVWDLLKTFQPRIQLSGLFLKHHI